jgi:hypothetical protein
MHQSPALGEMWLGVRRSFVDRIQRTLQRLVDGGDIRPIDPLLAASALGAMVEWSTFCFVELGEPEGEDVSLERLAATLTDLWFNAVYGKETVQPG